MPRPGISHWSAAKVYVAVQMVLLCITHYIKKEALLVVLHSLDVGCYLTSRCCVHTLPYPVPYTTTCASATHLVSVPYFLPPLLLLPILPASSPPPSLPVSHTLLFLSLLLIFILPFLIIIITFCSFPPSPSSFFFSFLFLHIPALNTYNHRHRINFTAIWMEALHIYLLSRVTWTYRDNSTRLSFPRTLQPPHECKK